ncbi:N-acetyl sugar amidotransferase [Amylibacter sp.]|nr:N-acetyl sugar amidotransferase [Amylibacter sp.]
MKYCTQCLSTDLRPNSHFSNGVCIACKYSQEDLEVNTEYKLLALKNKIKESQRSDSKKRKYDCIVGVSGGKDSTRQALWVRDRLQMWPLLVCVGYPPAQMSEIGAENISNLLGKGFDLITLIPAPKTSSRLTLESFKKFGNVCKSTEIALFSSVPRLAIELNVKFIFWGENPALQVGDSAVLGVDEFDGNNLRYLNTLNGGENDWISTFLGGSNLADHYNYPEEILYNKKKINILYLGPAWDDWSNEENSTYASLAGLTLRPGEEHFTGDISNASMLDEEFTNINMMLKYFKFGFGRATDYANEQIRNKNWTRSEAIEVVERFDGLCSDSIIEKYCNYTGITAAEFWDIANKWTNQDIFYVRKNKRPLKKFQVGFDYNC